MPSLIDMRRRIRSVRNTQQITKAMKMISAARLRRSQERAFPARPSAALLKAGLPSLASRAEEMASEAEHPLLARRPQNRVLTLVLTGDRGLCGAFNTNVIRTAERFLAEHRTEELELFAIGRKGRDYFRRRAAKIRQEYINIF